MKILGVIPARLQSTRLPDKPIKDIHGKSLIKRVWEQANKVKDISRLVIATDSSVIAEEASSFGAECLMTSSEHLSGTDRVAEAMQILSSQGEIFDIVANIQGDMPFINPKVISLTIADLSGAGQDFVVGTLATPIVDLAEFRKPSAVKVAIGSNGRALYFSRSAIPFLAENVTENVALLPNPIAYKHIGLYVFKPNALVAITKLKPDPLELRERLEQLRALSNGFAIKVTVVANELLKDQVEVDTDEDLERARKIAERSPNF